MEARKEHAVPASLIGTVQLRAFLQVRAFAFKKQSSIKSCIAIHANTLGYPCPLSGPSPSNAMECKVFTPDRMSMRHYGPPQRAYIPEEVKTILERWRGLRNRKLVSCPLLKYSKRTSGHPQSFFLSLLYSQSPVFLGILIH
jgi:hypothetical protein